MGQKEGKNCQKAEKEMGEIWAIVLPGRFTLFIPPTTHKLLYIVTIMVASWQSLREASKKVFFVARPLKPYPPPPLPRA